MRPIFVLIRKEFQQILRDRSMLAILFVAPLVQLFILGYTVTTDVKHLKLAYVDEDRSTFSRRLEASFRYSGYFDMVVPGAPRRDAETALHAGKADLIVVVPEAFSADLELGRSPAVQIIVDGQNSNLSALGLGYATGILQEISSDVIINKVVQSGAAGRIHLLEARATVYYNPNLESIVYMLPGIITVLLTLTTMLLTAMGLVREKEVGTFEQLIVTPIRPLQLLLGKLVPFALIGFAELTLALVVSVVWFDLPIVGSLFLVALAAFLFFGATLGMGLFISTISSTQQQALFIAWFGMVFGMLMSGFFYPIENMPEWAQALTLLNPLRYLISILRAVFLKGSLLSHLYLDFSALAALGGIIITLTILRFRSRIA